MEINDFWTTIFDTLSACSGVVHCSEFHQSGISAAVLQDNAIKISCVFPWSVVVHAKNWGAWRCPMHFAKTKGA